MSLLLSRLSSLYQRLTELASLQDFVLLWARVTVARIFYDSGRTKAQSAWGEGYITINDFQEVLFEEEYGIAFMDPAVLAQFALYAETFLPLMLLFGLASRPAAAMLLGMTIFIQLLVYPGHFMEHAMWATMLLAVLFLGPGKLSFDQFLGKFFVQNKK